MHYNIIRYTIGIRKKGEGTTNDFANFSCKYWVYRANIQKQSFADVLQNKCSWKFWKIHRKKKVLQSLFTKVAGLRVKDFIKRRLQYKALSCTIWKFPRMTFYIISPVGASAYAETGCFGKSFLIHLSIYKIPFHFIIWNSMQALVLNLAAV